MSSCIETFGTVIEGAIASFFRAVGLWVGGAPRKTLGGCIGIAILCGIGFLRWETENRPDELWVPQNTLAEQETAMYQSHFASESRFNTMIIQSATKGSNVLTTEGLVQAMTMHKVIESKNATVEETNYDFLELCTPSGGACASAFGGVCQCLVTSVLKQWNYDLDTLTNDTDIMSTLNNYGTQDDLKAALGNPQFDDNGVLVSAEAFTLSYFLQDRATLKDGSLEDPINEGWEKDVFLATTEAAPTTYPALALDYFAGRSFSDTFGDAISSDLLLVNISYVAAFLFLGATMGKILCGTGSRWTMALAALFTVGLSTASGFGISSAVGLFFGPVHSLLPFILLGIGVDDAFIIVNAFNRERKVSRSSETNDDLQVRSGRALARAGASITVTSLTDLVAFAISSSSRLPALASFCGYASISIFFLWFFASTFFTGTMVLDERRQRDNRRECLCCVTRKRPMEEDDKYEEDYVSRYFRNYHGPAILSNMGKVVVLAVFSGLIGFGIYGTLNLSVEDSERQFVPADSYLASYIETADKFYPDQGIDLYITFEGSAAIYESRQGLAELDTRLSGKSQVSPYIAEPVSQDVYRNAMSGLYNYLLTEGTSAIGGATLGDDSWPTTEADFVTTLLAYANFTGPGAIYAQDVSLDDSNTVLKAYRVQSEYVRLTKLNRGEVIDDADRQIEAMDDTRAMVDSWTDLQPNFPYSPKFISIEGFKIIQRELFLNVGLAIGAVAIIVLFTVASPVTAFLITLNVAMCIVEILGCMWALGIVIDSVSVINIVLAVGLSVDYSAHVGHCFMIKGGNDKNKRALEALADIGAAVLSGGISTFLAVVVLLFSSSYVFVTLSRQFAVTVALGLLHGLVLLPVLLALLGPKPFASAEAIDGDDDFVAAKEIEDVGATEHPKNGAVDSSSSEEEPVIVSEEPVVKHVDSEEVEA